MNNYKSTVHDIPVERKSYKNSSLRFVIPKHVHNICLAPSSAAFRGTFLFKCCPNLSSFLFLYRYAFYPSNLYCSLMDHLKYILSKIFHFQLSIYKLTLLLLLLLLLLSSSLFFFFSSSFSFFFFSSFSSFSSSSSSVSSATVPYRP